MAAFVKRRHSLFSRDHEHGLRTGMSVTPNGEREAWGMAATMECAGPNRQGERVKVFYGARSSKPHRPRVMRCISSVGSRDLQRSVDRGLCRPAIEPRKCSRSGCRHRSIGWEATWMSALLRALRQSCVVREPGVYTNSLFGNREIFGSAFARGSVSGRCQSRSR
jgi:hypothetical protein